MSVLFLKKFKRKQFTLSLECILFYSCMEFVLDGPISKFLNSKFRSILLEVRFKRADFKISYNNYYVPIKLTHYET